MSQKQEPTDNQVNDFLDVLGLRDYARYGIDGYNAILPQMQTIVKRKFTREDLDEVLNIINRNNDLIRKLDKLKEIDEDIVKGSQSLEKNKRDDLIVSLMQLQLYTLLNLFVNVQKDCPKCPGAEKIPETIKEDFMPLIEKLIEKYKETANLAKTGHIEYGKTRSQSPESVGSPDNFASTFNQVYNYLESQNRPTSGVQRGGYEPSNQNDALAAMFLLLNHAKKNQSARNVLLRDGRKAVVALANNLDGAIRQTYNKLSSRLGNDKKRVDAVIRNTDLKLRPILSSMRGGGFDQKHLKYKSRYIQYLNENS